MTPAIMEDIWEKSNVKGSPRLLLLAIAKHANHDGTNAYPSLATLAHLTKLSHSQVCLILRQLVKDGHVRIEHGAGPKGSNAYTIVRTWDAISSPKIGHAKTAHAIGRPSIGPNQEPKTKKGPGGSSDVLASDVLSSDPTPSPVVTPAAANWLRTIAHELTPDFAQVLQGTPLDTAEEMHTVHPPPLPTKASTSACPPRKSRGEGLYTLGKLCKRGHDHEGTGKSLRRLPSGSCLQCDLERQEAKRQAQVQARRAAKPTRRIIDLAAHRQAQGG